MSILITKHPSEGSAAWLNAKAFAEALELACPLLSSFTPETFEDFRTKTPTSMRVGVGFYADDIGTENVRFTVRLWSEMAAFMAARRIDGLLPGQAVARPAMIRQTERTIGGSVSWVVEFCVQTKWIPEITEALAPQMNGK